MRDGPHDRKAETYNKISSDEGMALMTIYVQQLFFDEGLNDPYDRECTVKTFLMKKEFGKQKNHF